MKAKTLMNKIIIVGGLSACLLLGGCGAGQAADATSAESTVAAQESTVTPTESTEATETVSTETAQDEAQRLHRTKHSFLMVSTPLNFPRTAPCSMSVKPVTAREH